MSMNQVYYHPIPLVPAFPIFDINGIMERISNMLNEFPWFPNILLNIWCSPPLVKHGVLENPTFSSMIWRKPACLGNFQLPCLITTLNQYSITIPLIFPSNCSGIPSISPWNSCWRTSPKSPPFDLVPGQAEKLAALFAKSCIALGKWFIIYVFSDIIWYNPIFIYV